VHSIINNAIRIRRLELVVLFIGMLIALIILGLGARGAFRVNMAGGHEVEGFVLTLFSYLIMGVIVVSPYAVLASLGKKIISDGEASHYQISGLVISFLVTCVSIYLYVDAHFVVAHDRSSTAGLVFLALPMSLIMVGGGLYGILVLMYLRSQKGMPPNDAL